MPKPLSAFEKVLPWTGATAGLLWAANQFLPTVPDSPGDTDAVAAINDAYARNLASGFVLLAAALMLAFFSAAVRRAQRAGEAGEAGEATYSSVAHAGAVAAGGGLSLLAILQIAISNAAHDGDPAAVATIGQLHLIGWLPALVGFVALFWATGLGGLRNATLPRWFAIVSIVLGALGVLGPLAMAVYLLLPLWLVAASAVFASRQRITVPDPLPTSA